MEKHEPPRWLDHTFRIAIIVGSIIVIAICFAVDMLVTWN